MMTDTLEELRQLLEKARTADAELKQFGAKDHQYQWNPPAALAEVEAFERDLGAGSLCRRATATFSSRQAMAEPAPFTACSLWSKCAAGWDGRWSRRSRLSFVLA